MAREHDQFPHARITTKMGTTNGNRKKEIESARNSARAERSLARETALNGRNQSQQRETEHRHGKRRPTAENRELHRKHLAGEKMRAGKPIGQQLLDSRHSRTRQNRGNKKRKLPARKEAN
jgi:hypothetical protein